MRFRTSLTAILFVLSSLIAATASFATTIVLPTDDQLIAKSPVIVTGVVRSTTAVDREGAIWTETILDVDRVLKGKADNSVVIRELGGAVGDRVSVVFGSAEYMPGEQVLVFLWPTERGDYQTRDLFIGKFSERFSIEGERLWYRPETAANTQLLDAEFRPIATNNVQRRSEQFYTYVRDRVAGREGQKNYGVEAPTLRPQHQITADFTLISEPNLYRWFAFDKGGSAAWKSVSTQPGYADGGVSELKTSLTPWTTLSGARIGYSYSGVSSSTPGGLGAPNGINEVIFNDVKNEIDGSWSGSTGGVVGRGGFNRVVSGGSWTSPFAADASHPAKTYSSTGNITEGNLVIQDGVSPANGISSTTLTSILAHEFGHTLGFGHTPDTTALMYQSVRSGGGYGLNADDMQAARWLYPGAAVQPPPPPLPTAPAAPANVRANALSSTEVQLDWSIVATNATAQTIYSAVGSGAFSRVGDVSASSTTARLGSLKAGTTYRFHVTARNSAGESQPSNIAQAVTPGGSPASPTGLALLSNRFRVTLTARDQRTGNAGTGVPMPQNDLFGYFSIPALTGTTANPEVFVKVLDGRPVNGSYWVFYGGLTDLEYTIFVTDLVTGRSKQYVKPAGSACGGFDTGAFSSAGGDPVPVIEESLEAPSDSYEGPIEILDSGFTESACSGDASSLCVNSSRFRVALSARDQRTGKTAPGQAIPQNNLFGYFSIPALTGNAANPEVFVKVLDGRAANGRFWVFYGGLTDLEYTVTVTDTVTGAIKRYSKAPGSACGGFDTSAF